MRNVFLAFKIDLSIDIRPRRARQTKPRFYQSRRGVTSCGRLVLVLASNEAAVEFYNRLGYVIEERISMGKILETN